MMWLPCVSAGAVAPDVQAKGAPPSKWHEYVAPGSVLKVIVGVALVRAPGETMFTMGPVESTLHVSVAGVSSTLLAMSTARTENECGFWVSTRFEYALGEEQGANAESIGASLHSNVPGRVDVNENDTFRPETDPGPEVMVVSRMLVSTCYAYVA